MRRLALLLVAASALSACGSSGTKTTAPVGTVPSPAMTKQEIKSAYQKFFSGRTSIPDRVAVLENGPKFKPLVTSFAKNPLAKNVSVTVSSVTLQGANDAKVVYTVKLGGAGLPKQTGTAVRQNGVWKVGDESLCKLVSLQGSTPSVCKS